LTIHGGGQAVAPLLATAECCEEKQGSSKIELVESSTTVSLEHIPRRALIFAPKTTFTFNGKEYYWKGYTDLFEQKTDKLTAQYSPIESSGNKVGEILIAEGKDNEVSKQLQDLIIISTFVMEQRSNARQRAVCHLLSCLTL
jgi:hypothetical protein